MKKYFIPSLLFLVPVFAFAQAGNDIWSLWAYVFKLIQRISQILWILTIVSFLFGLVQFLQKADDPAAQKNAKVLMKGSIIAFFLAVTFWGLVTFAIGAFNLTPDQGSGSIDTVTSRG